VNALLASSPRYLTVSIICVVLNMMLLVSLDQAGIHYTVAVLVSALVLIPTSYALHLVVTYRVAPRIGSFLRYAATQLVNTPAAIVLFFLIRDRAGLPMIWAAPTVTALMFLYNITSSFWAISYRPLRRAR
jgi:putative flippase GtrA